MHNKSERVGTRWAPEIPIHTGGTGLACRSAGVGAMRPSAVDEDDPWARMSVLAPDDDGAPTGAAEETTPLNSPEKASTGRGLRGRSRSRSPEVARARREVALARNEAQALAETNDMRKSKLVILLFSLFVLEPLFEGLVLLGLSTPTATAADVANYGQSTRELARVVQIVATVFTLLLSLYTTFVLRRWQQSVPRFAALAATQFALLPEYKAISLVLDVGKLAYPYGMRVPLVAMIMSLRVAEVLVLLRISYMMGLRRGLVDAKVMHTYMHACMHAAYMYMHVHACISHMMGLRRGLVDAKESAMRMSICTCMYSVRLPPSCMCSCA